MLKKLDTIFPALSLAKKGKIRYTVTNTETVREPKGRARGNGGERC